MDLLVIRDWANNLSPDKSTTASFLFFVYNDTLSYCYIQLFFLIEIYSTLYILSLTVGLALVYKTVQITVLYTLFILFN